MHLFKHFFKLLSRNIKGLIIYGIITVVMVMMLVTTVSNSGSDMVLTAEAKSYNISFVDNDNSPLSRGLIDYLGVNNKVSDYSKKSETEISNIVFFGMTSYHFTIPSGFANDVVNGRTENGIIYQTIDGSNGYVSFELGNRIDSYLNTYRNYLSLGLSENEAINKTKETLIDEAPITVVAENEEDAVVDSREIVIFNVNQYFPYLILGILSLGVGHTVIITNKKELVERNTVSPVPAYMTKFINTVGLLISGIICWALFMAFDFIYGAGTEIMSKYGWIILINSLLSTLCCSAIAALLTNYIETSNTLSMVTNIVGLAMSFFCGVFVPMRFVGEKVLSISKFLPFYWTVLANNMTSSVQSKYAFDMNQVLICFAVELLFVISISTIAIISNSKRIIRA
ncbi:MAG: ABC transporter permease [Clostridia bacterium]|nr:ABC transporter permease [Clostridia bacterium]